MRIGRNLFRTDATLASPYANHRFGRAYYATDTLVVNQRATDNACLPPAIAAPASMPGRALLRSAVALLACALCAFAQSPPTSGIERMVANDAVRQLASDDAETRGEAALIVAAAGRVEQEPRLLALADDPDPVASHRATLALGLLATPQAITHLEEELRTIEGRTSDKGVVAAFALGMVPTDKVDTSVARTLTLFEHGSWKRQHDILIALLIGMKQQPERSERRALELLFEDEANRAAESRALLLELLLPMARSKMTQRLDDRELRRVLRRGSEMERLAIVNWMAGRVPAENKDWIGDLVRIQKRGDSPELRSAALLALTRYRYLPALELAAHALKSKSAVECSQALRSMMAIGGSSTHGALEQHLLDEKKPQRIQALMQNFPAPPSQKLVAHAIKVATDPKMPIATRAAAAELVGRRDKKRAAPLLRDLFRIATQPDVLTSLARALRRAEDTPTALSRLMDRPVSLTQHAERWQALLAAGHGEAQRQVLATLKDPKASQDDVRTAMKAWRRAMVIDSAGSLAPERLANCLK